MKYKLGDTIRVEDPAVFKALTEEEMNVYLAYIVTGQVPPEARVTYTNVLLITQEMVDKANETK